MRLTKDGLKPVDDFREKEEEDMKILEEEI